MTKVGTKTESFAFFRQFLFQDHQILQSPHYWVHDFMDDHFGAARFVVIFIGIAHFGEDFFVANFTKIIIFFSFCFFQFFLIILIYKKKFSVFLFLFFSKTVEDFLFIFKKISFHST